MFVLIIISMWQVSLFPQSGGWKEYRSPEEAGFDIKMLNKVRTYFDSLGAAGALIIYKNNVLINWDENSRRFMCASVRKSFLSALIGIEIKSGKLSLNQTLRDLGINDRTPLTDGELDATLYNNWDFNVLGFIYEKTINGSIAEAFNKKIAGPVGMEDFRQIDVSELYEETGSKYPAYTFKMSARDMARFGLLYLQSGKWDGKQIISEEWIKESTSSKILFDDGYGYGYLWWSTTINGHRVYFAKGIGVQGIYIVPDMDIVFVFRVNTYGRSSVNDGRELKLLSMIMDAKIQEENMNPNLILVSWVKKTPIKSKVTLSKNIFGKYLHSQLGVFEVLQRKNNIILHTNPVDFIMYPLTDSTAYIEDLDMIGVLKKDAIKHGTVEFEHDAKREN